MAIRKAFLSSTGKDLAEYRQAVFEAINGLDGWKCVRMEEFGARARPIYAFDADAVRGCDLFIGILGHCYGTIPKGHNRSYTEQEYDTAVALNLPRLMFIAPDDFPLPAGLREPEDCWKRQQAFRVRAQADQLAGRFSTPANLANEVLQAIRNWEEEERRKEDQKKPQGGLAEPVTPSVITPPVPRSDWLAGLLTYPQSFVEDFFALVSGPKRFVAERLAAGTLTIGRSLGFLAVTTAIMWAIPSHFHFQVSVVSDIASDFTFLFAQLIVYGLVLYLAWRSVGGKAAFRDYLPLYLYFSSVYILLLKVCVNTYMGVLHASDQKLYSDIVQSFRDGYALQYMLSADYRTAASNSPSIIFVTLAAIFYGSLIIIWAIASWGAYRVLNDESRLRSAMAAFVFLLLSVFAYGALAIVAEAFIAASTAA